MDFLKSYKLGFSVIAVFFFVQLLLMPHYGLTWDEPSQWQIGKANLDFIIGQHNYIDLVRKDAIYYGPSFEILNQWAGSLFLKFGFGYIDAFHLLIVITSMAGFVFFYLLAVKMLDKKAGITALLFLIISPRFIAHSFYNSKDIPIAVLTIIVIYYLYLFLQNKQIKWLILAGIFQGISLSIRIDAVITLVIFGLATLISGRWKQLLRYSWLFILVAVLTMFITWPALWKEPSLFLKSINFFLNHDWQGEVLYLGKIYPGASLPWHYPLVYVFIANSILIWGFFIVGLIKIFKGFKEKTFEYGLLLAWFFVPILINMKPGVLKYDGVRHLFLVFPPLMIWAALGASRLWQIVRQKFNLKTSQWLGITLGGVLMFEFWEIQPFGDSYFNEILRILLPSHIENYLEIEYWGASYKQGVEWLNENVSKYTVVCIPIADHLVQLYPVRSVIKFACNRDSNYLMYISRKTYLPKDLGNYFKYDLNSPVFKITKYNSDLLYVYKIDENLIH